ncbi:hypothetical protein [uncultured Pseudacidovorax sp.]|uniref:hypothetical protein n=1 Tax=uncultured Pseudacidovorax sp. TaxID=679313 RepID=UPI0025D7E92A|nr:hypothetical protein [uncultured Pseudacidovorax sp.]
MNEHNTTGGAGNILAVLAQEPSTTIQAPVAKAATAIASATGAQVIDSAQTGAGMFTDLMTLTWPNLAAAAACLYSLALLTEFCWKRFWRPFFERLGWIKPKPRLVLTAEEWAAMRPGGDD